MTLALLVLQSLALLPLVVLSNRASALLLVLMVLATALRRQPLGRTATLPPLLALLGFGALSALWSVDPGNTLGKVGQLAAVAFAIFALAAPPKADADADRLARLTMIGWGSGAAIALLDFVGHGIIIAALRATVGDFDRLHAPHLVEKAGATALGLALFPVIAAIERLRLPRLAVPGAMIVAILVALTASADAAALLPVIGCIAWLLHRRFPRQIRDLLRFGLPAAVLAMPLLPMLTDPITTLQAIPQINLSNFYRLTIWDYAYDQIVQRPWLGWGLDSARVFPGGNDTFTVMLTLPGQAAPVEFSAGHLPLHTHNGPLQLWLEMGAAGAVLMALCLWRMLSAAIAPTASAAPVSGLFAAATLPFLVSFGVFQSWWLALLVMLWVATRNLLPESE